jgi:hypothetical protein
VGQTTSRYHQQVLDKEVVYHCSCCGETCSSAPDHLPSPASIGRHCDTWRRRCPASTAWRRRASGTSRVPLTRLPLGVLRRRSLEACWTSLGTSPRRPATHNTCQMGTQH